MAQQGADHTRLRPLLGTANTKGQTFAEGQLPERGVIEVKSATDDAWLTAEGGQVSKYWGLYRASYW